MMENKCSKKWLVKLIIFLVLVASVYFYFEWSHYKEARDRWELFRKTDDVVLSIELFNVSASGMDSKSYALELVHNVYWASDSRSKLIKIDSSAVDEVVQRLREDHAWIGFTDEQWNDLWEDIACIERSINEQIEHIESGGTVKDYNFKFLREEEAKYCAKIMKRINEVKNR